MAVARDMDVQPPHDNSSDAPLVAAEMCRRRCVNHLFSVAAPVGCLTMDTHYIEYTHRGQMTSHCTLFKVCFRIAERPLIVHTPSSSSDVFLKVGCRMFAHCLISRT